MTVRMPTLTGNRITVREFRAGDLEEVHRVLYRAWQTPEQELTSARTRHERRLHWTIESYDQLSQLDQPPYGDRAICTRDGRLVGVVGLVPCLGPFRRLPGFPDEDLGVGWSTEVGLYWAVDPEHQGQGYATQAGHLVMQFAFEDLHLERVIATTRFDNAGSIGVMRKLRMSILRNPTNEPLWLQIVGVRGRENRS